MRCVDNSYLDSRRETPLWDKKSESTVEKDRSGEIQEYILNEQFFFGFHPVRPVVLRGTSVVAEKIQANLNPLQQR